MRDCLIYLYAKDQSKRIDQLQCIINALIRVLSSIRIFSSAFYPPSAFSYPRFILHPHSLIRIFSSAICIRHPYPRFIPTRKQRRTKQQFGKCCNKHCLYNTLMASFCMERLLFVKKFTLYFRRLNFFFWSIVIVLLLQQVNCQKLPVYTAESCSNESLFCFFSTKIRTNCDPTKPYQSLINFVCSVCTGKYCLRFLSHRPRSFVARSVRKPQAILSRTDLALG